MGATGRAAEGPESVGTGREPDPGAPVLGQVIGDCELVSVMGAGAMGIVYQARQRSLGRTVALKVIREEIARLPEYRERFLREARLAASVDHPHVVSVYDAGEQDGRLYLTMQWVPGEDLRQLLERCGRLDPAEAVAIVTQLAGALDAIHAARLIHRDVKPANIVIRDVGGRDHAYLTDFGLVKFTDASVELTKAGRVLGTPGYLSPEQIEGESPGSRSDLYALGCVLFELLTGRPPFRADSELALLTAHVMAPRPRPSQLVPGLGEGWDEFFAVALAVAPEERWGSGRELADALTRVETDGGPTAVRARAAGPGAPPVPTAARTAATAPAGIPSRRSPAASPPKHDPRVRRRTAPAPARGRRRRVHPGVVILCLLAVAAGAVGGLLAAGVIPRHHPARTQVAGSAGSGAATPPPASSSSSVPARSAATQSTPRSSTACTPDVTAGPDTSCAFAMNVQRAYDHGPGGAVDLKVYSPKTGLTYAVHCTGGIPHVCRTAEGALITFSTGPSYWPGSAPPAGLTACDQNIARGPQTSCPFADAVFRAYVAAYRAGAGQRAQVNATSPDTGQRYVVGCASDGTVVRCTTASGALVSFPLRAVQVY